MKPMNLSFSAAASLCALALSLTACIAEEDPEGTAWRAIESGSQSNIEEATQQVIQDDEAWKTWWKSHNTAVEFIDGKEIEPAPPAVDFAKETLLIATMGMRSSGGFGIEFTGIHHQDETLVATFKTTSPGPDDMVTMALTAPFAIIAVAKHEGPVEFVEAE